MEVLKIVDAITNEMLVEYIQKGINTRENLERLWIENIKLIRIIVTKLTGLNDCDKDFEDMIQEAFIGFMEAVQRYDSSFDVKFFTHAEIYIKKSIYRYYDNNGYSIRIPTYMKTRIREYMKARERIEQEKNRKADDNEIMEFMKISISAYKAIIKAVQRLNVESLDKYIYSEHEKDGARLDIIASDQNVEEAGIENIYHKELHEILFKAIEKVPSIEREIIIAYYFQKYTYKKIAALYGCTRENIRQHIKRSFQIIRMGKYGNELLSFLPEQAINRAKKKIDKDLEELTEKERGFLI